MGFSNYTTQVINIAQVHDESENGDLENNSNTMLLRRTRWLVSAVSVFSLIILMLVFQKIDHYGIIGFLGISPLLSIVCVVIFVGIWVLTLSKYKLRLTGNELVSQLFISSYYINESRLLRSDVNQLVVHSNDVGVSNMQFKFSSENILSYRSIKTGDALNLIKLIKAWE